MYEVLSITLPFFAIIFLGTFFHFKKVFDNDSSKVLTRYALFITLPPFMFVNIIKSSDNVIFNFDFILRFEAITIFLLILTFAISIYFIKNNKSNSALFALNCAYPNYGYMGIPLCILAFGEIAAVPISLILLIDSIVLLSFTGFFIDYDKDKSIFLKIYQFFLNLFKNPILLGVIIGFIFVIFKIQIPLMIFSFLEIISYAATPTALFAIGINLYNKIENKALNNILTISFFKLIVHPILIFIIFICFPHNVDPIWIKVAILSACLPVAGNVFAMSILYNNFINQTSGSILITTILSTFTVPLVLYLLLNLNYF